LQNILFLKFKVFFFLYVLGSGFSLMNELLHIHGELLVRWSMY